MKKLTLLIALLLSHVVMANDFDIESTFGLHKGMTKKELEKVIVDFKKQPEEPNFYCTTYNSTYVPIKGEFDYYIYTFYKDNELVGITGVKQNTSKDFFTRLIMAVKNIYGNETDKNTNTDYLLKSYDFYYWTLEKSSLDTIYITFSKYEPHKINISYFLLAPETCSKK